MTYADFTCLFSRRVTVFGTEQGPWGLVKWEPESSPDPRCSVAQFYTTDLKPFSGEIMSLKGGYWRNDGFRNADGSINQIYVISQRIGGHPGHPPEGQDITTIGGPQKYALDEVPDYNYWIWTKGRIEQNEFAHSQWWGVPRMVTNPYWRGEGSSTRLCIEMREEWYEAVNGVWTMTHCRTCYCALDTGTIWRLDDHLNAVQIGMIYAYDY